MQGQAKKYHNSILNCAGIEFCTTHITKALRVHSLIPLRDVEKGLARRSGKGGAQSIHGISDPPLPIQR